MKLKFPLKMRDVDVVVTCDLEWYAPYICAINEVEFRMATTSAPLSFPHPTGLERAHLNSEALWAWQEAQK